MPNSLLKEDTTSTQIQIKLNKVGFDKLSLEEEKKVLEQMGKEIAEDYISRLTPVQQRAFGVVPKQRYEKMIGPKTEIDILLDTMDLVEEPIDHYYERERIRKKKERKRYFEANYNMK